MLKCQWNTTSFQSVHLFIVYTISETSQDSADGVAPQGCVLNACTKGVHVMLSTLLSYAATSKQAPDPGDCLQPNSSMQFPVVSMQEKMDSRRATLQTWKNIILLKPSCTPTHFDVKTRKPRFRSTLLFTINGCLFKIGPSWIGGSLDKAWLPSSPLAWPDGFHFWVGWPETKATALWMFYPYCLWMTVAWWFNTNVRWVWRFKTRQRQLLVLHYVSYCIIAIHSSPVARFFPPWQRNHCPMHPGITASCTRVPQTGYFSWDPPHCEPFLFGCGFMLGPL